MAKENKGIYQIRRIKLDLRDSRSTTEDAETKLNSELLELQQNANIEIIDVVEMKFDSAVYYFLIKYRDYGISL